MLRRWAFGQGLFVLLAVAFLGTGFWGVSQSKMLLSEEQMKQVTGGIDLDVSLSPLNATWRPMGAPTNNTAEITVTVTGDDTEWLSGCHINFTLSSTDYVGYCMNYGSQGEYDADLQLLDDSEQNSYSGLTWDGGGSSITATFGSPPTPPTTFVVKVKAYDYGAFGTLGATLFYEGSAQGWGSTITIPRDDNGNAISDGWKLDKDFYNYNASADSETGPSGNGNSGDGFSVYQEYRGLRLEGNWTDLLPTKKDYFVFSNVTMNGTDVGYGYALNMPTPLQVHRIAVNEWNSAADADRVVNYKGTDVPGRAHNQKALKVIPSEGSSTLFGATWPGLGTPNYVTKIVIYLQKIRDAAGSSTRWPEATRKVIGHEIGHGVNLEHCSGHACLMKGTTTNPYYLPTDYNTTHNSQYQLH